MQEKINSLVKQLETVENTYKPIPFWSWNGKLETEELKRQIQWMKQTHNGGFFMHARSGLKTPYLSEEWMTCIEACAEAAGDMQPWIYDENGWPSGFAGGKLLEEEANRDQYLLHTLGDFDPKATVSYYLEEGRLLRTDAAVPGKEHLNVTVHISVSTADILNPRVTEQFLQLTHEAYKKRFGDAFSEKIVGFFTDEPQYQRWYTPYTPAVEEYFRTELGQDIFDGLGLLFVEAEGYRSFRYSYWKAMQQLMLNNFSKKVYDWCEDHGVKLTGHYVEESTMGFQLMCCAGVMPFYEYEHIPGIDWLGNEADNELSARQVGSAACQLGKKQVITETFGCCGHDITPGDLRRILGFQYVNGVNLLCHHLIPYVEYGQSKRDHPAHYSPRNPWVEESFGAFNLYASRLGKLLACGSEQVNVAMLHPIRSSYFDYKREEEDFAIGLRDARLRQDCRLLSSCGVAYHFLDETLLEKHGFVEGSRIGCGSCTYEYLVLPHVLTMDASTEKLLRQYVEQGGKLLILGDGPSYLEGEPHTYDYLRSNCDFAELCSAQPLGVAHSEQDLYYSFRLWEGMPVLVVQNADPDGHYTQTFRLSDGFRSFEKLDLLTMTKTKVPLTVTFEPGETAVLFPLAEAPGEQPRRKEAVFSLEKAQVSFRENFFTLDMVSYSKDGQEFSEPYPCRGLFYKLLQEQYEGPLYLRYTFSVREKPARLSLLAEPCSVSEQWLNGKPLEMTRRGRVMDHTYEGDITDLIRVGENDYTVKVLWHQNEQVYYALFGENVTESLKNCIVYDSELEAVYLSGDFGVYSDQPYEDDGNYTFGEAFYVGKAPTAVTEPVFDGLPFFRGTLTVSQKIELEEGVTHLRVNGTYQSARVHINGQFAGTLLFEQVLDIEKYAAVGMNDVRIDFVISNRNLLGPHHYPVKIGRRFVGPHVWELGEAWMKDETSCYRRNYEFVKLCAGKKS